MKKIVFASLALILCLNNYAQTNDDYIELAREVLKTEKKAAIAEVLDLNETESVPFWELYNEYQNKVYAVQNNRIALINDFSDNYENLTDEKADELFQSLLKYKTDILKLKKQYYKKFKKIVGTGDAARFFQAENKIETLIDAQLALEIPLLETAK